MIISHRGLLTGPDTNLQNNPDQVEKALAEEFDVEIDVWFLNNKYYLGHDEPHYEVNWNWLSHANLWIHCKNLPAFFNMRERTIIHNYFWHETDSVILTSRNKLWTFMGKPETENSECICVLPEATYTWYEIEQLVKTRRWMGYCTDYPRLLAKWQI